MSTEETSDASLLPQATFVFVVIASLGAIIWDILVNLNADYYLLHRFAMSWTVIVYFLARIATLTTFAITTAAGTNPMNHCSPILTALRFFLAIAISFTTLLFFFRIRAVCLGNKYLVFFFFFLWISVVGVSFGFTLQESIVGDILDAPKSTHYCLSDPVNLTKFMTAISTVPLANDVLGFIAVTRQLMQNASVEATFQSGWKIAILGKGLPAFSRALLKDSQAYYLLTVTIGIFSTIAFYGPKVLQGYSTTFAFVNVAIMNLMGGKIYRNTRLGISMDASSASLPSQPMMFRAGNDVHCVNQDV